MEACAPGRGMAPVRAHRTIPGCPDAYNRCSARNNPRLVRGAPSKRTAAAARPRWCKALDRRLDLRRDFDKPRPSASARHQPPITPLSRPTLLTGQGLAQAEKPKPACSLAPHSSRASTGEETADRPPSGPPARRRAATLQPLARLAQVTYQASWTVKIMAAPPRRAGRPGLKQLLWHEERERG